MEIQILDIAITAVTALTSFFGAYFLLKDKIKAETEKFNSEKKKADLESEEIIRKLDSTNNLIKDQLLLQGQPYNKGYEEAFANMKKLVTDELDSHKRRGLEKPRIKLKLIAVSMAYSWGFFIKDFIIEILNNYQDARIELDLLFVDYEFLQGLDLSIKKEDWAKKSKFHETEVLKFVQTQCPKFKDRLTFNVNKYRNLPHWHGWLVNVNEDHLFLGRTNWNFEEDKPTLLVGTNKYRHFDTSSTEGTERVNLYQNWHKYYTDASTVICSFP